jgi:hypothetical protein
VLDSSFACAGVRIGREGGGGGDLPGGEEVVGGEGISKVVVPEVVVINSGRDGGSGEERCGEEGREVVDFLRNNNMLQVGSRTRCERCEVDGTIASYRCGCCAEKERRGRDGRVTAGGKR